MILNYIKTALRALYRDKWYSIVNIGGLAIGMCVAIILSIYVIHEHSFDRFHSDYERIYRLHNHFTREGLPELKLPCTIHQTGTSLVEKESEIEDLVRLFFWNTGEVKIGDERKSSKRIIYTDSTFFDLFNFPIVRGNSKNPLSDPYNIIISEDIASEWFGSNDPIGKTIQIQTYDFDTLNRGFYQKPIILSVSAVMKNTPKNSHLKFDIVTSFRTMSPIFLQVQGQDFYTYIKFFSPITKDIIKSVNEINAFEVERALGKSHSKETMRTELMALNRIHLHAKFQNDTAITSSSSFVTTLGVVAFLVLIIASINFINLTTARADKRKREVGVRKSLGSSRIQIISQFIGESVLSSLLALFVSLMLTELLIGPFNNLLNASISFDYNQHVEYFAIVVFMALLVGLLGGIYPSLYVSRFKPITILRGLTETGKQNHFVKSVLITFQFGIAALLIFGLIVINTQIQYTKKKDLGFDPHNVVLFFGINENLAKSYQAIQHDIKSVPGVISISAAQSYPSEVLSGMNLRLEGSEPTTAFSVKENRVQDFYIETMGMQIVNGRDFIKNSTSDNEGYIINQTAAKMLGLNDPIGARVIMWQRPGEIIGVVKDYHFASVRNNIDPLVISRYNPRMNNLTIRIADQNRSETLKQITSILQKYEPNYTPSYQYLTDLLQKQYGAEERTFNLILSASIVALLLSMVGLYALSAYSLACRTKELGVRKILGASKKSLYSLLVIDSTKWVMAANIIALPIGWYFAKGWLNDFAYRVDIEPWIFITAAISTYAIALLTIAWQVRSAARSNPVEALKYE